MNANLSSIPCLTPITDIPAHEVVPCSIHVSGGCRRCGGMMVDEHCTDIGEEGSRNKFWGMRCIQCGDVIDDTILRNRYAHVQTLQKLRSRTRRSSRVQILLSSVGSRRIA